MNPLEALALTLAALFALSSGVVFLASLVHLAMFIRGLRRQTPTLKEER